MLNKIQKGFTLVELMVVVAIIGVIVAIAIPRYQNYIIQTQMARVVHETGNLRIQIENCISENRTNLGYESDECDSGATASNILTGSNQMAADPTPPPGAGFPSVSFQGTEPFDVNATSVIITGTFGNSAHAVLRENDVGVIWMRDGRGNWTCYIANFPEYLIGMAWEPNMLWPIDESLERYIPLGCKSGG